MPGWLVDVAGPIYAQALLWTVLVLLVLVVFSIIVKLFRSLTSGTYLAGGRARKHRLSVIDATAVDNYRRLILVRRDDVEHLLLIGGPTDVLVESRIAVKTAEDQAAAVVETVPVKSETSVAKATREEKPVIKEEKKTAAVLQPVAAEPTRATPLADLETLVSEPKQPAPAVREPEPKPAPQPVVAQAAVKAEAPAPQPAPAPQSAPVAKPVIMPEPAPIVVKTPEPPQLAPAAAVIAEPVLPSLADDLDDALLKELEVSLEDEGEALPPVKPAPTQGSTSLDDEMTRLLGELSRSRR